LGDKAPIKKGQVIDLPTLFEASID